MNSCMLGWFKSSRNVLPSTFPLMQLEDSGSQRVDLTSENRNKKNFSYLSLFHILYYWVSSPIKHQAHIFLICFCCQCSCGSPCSCPSHLSLLSTPDELWFSWFLPLYARNVTIMCLGHLPSLYFLRLSLVRSSPITQAIFCHSWSTFYSLKSIFIVFWGSSTKRSTSCLGPLCSLG